MLSSKLRESFSICSAAAESSVELDADCCTSSRILSMARTTACAPEACSSTAELISWVISVRRLVALAICEEPTDCSLVAAPISWELVDFRNNVGNLVESRAEIVSEGQTFLNDARAAFHVLDGLTSFALYALDEGGNFLGGLRRLFGQLTDFISDDGKTKSAFTGTSRFDGRVQGEQVGLFGNVINDFDDLADVIGAMAENVDDFGGRLDGLVGAAEAIGGLLHGLNAGDDFFARAVGDIVQERGC